MLMQDSWVSKPYSKIGRRHHPKLEKGRKDSHDREGEYNI